MDSHAKLGAVRFALLGLLQLNLHDFVRLSLFVLLSECTVEFAILTPSLAGVLTMHTIVLICAVEFSILNSFVNLSLESGCSELPFRCAGNAHLSTNERKVQRT